VRVLVVEDDRSVRETLGIVLESYNYTVDLVDGGEEALSVLEKNWPDAMLLDLALMGMSGEELYWRIKERFNRVPPTIVLSAVQHGEARVRNMPGVKFLAKPYTLDELNQTIQEVAGKQAA
jgi:DNA-binding response OmpR family regulator